MTPPYRNGRNITIWAIVAVVAGLTIVALCGVFLSAVRNTPITPVTCATYQDASGVWRETDGEELDSDPCDMDDMFEIDVPKTTKPPVVVKTTKPPAPKPSRRR